MEILRPAVPDDWKSLNDLCRQVQQLHISWRPDIFCSAQIPYPMEYLLEDIKAEAIFCAEMNGEVVGSVRCYTWTANGEGSVPSKVLDIDDITVDQQYRHRGIGQKIMADVKQIARDRNCNDIQLSVYPQNEAAIRFYEACGFRVRNIRYQMYL